MAKFMSIVGHGHVQCPAKLVLYRFLKEERKRKLGLVIYGTEHGAIQRWVHGPSSSPQNHLHALLSTRAEPRCVKRISQKIRTRTMSPFLNGPTGLPTKGVPGWLIINVQWTLFDTVCPLCRISFIFFFALFYGGFVGFLENHLFWAFYKYDVRCLGCYDKFMGSLSFFLRFLKIYR